ncbi:DUF6058 family natural product biosynthesis protein [Pseudoxanthomonas sp. 22568]|uniref:DUF6058 family natural product biosynthesis protein n=1 Tax=Pseudoxanthomonas sp. 22568 TaxID=3453945 RepID=UPI003F835D46
MNRTDAYLRHHYWTDTQLANACGLTLEQLDALLAEDLVPAPSYVVSADGTLHSAAFGEFPQTGATPGRYFHPGTVAWVTRAQEARAQGGAEAARATLEQRFRHGFAAALAGLDRELARLPDSFDDHGTPIAAGLDTRTAGAWDAFRQGIFGLCVADPATEQAIATKEILQEALTTLRERHLRDAPGADIDRTAALALIQRYARAAMPFSPLEYPRSSRKRLVEDFAADLHTGAVPG